MKCGVLWSEINNDGRFSAHAHRLPQRSHRLADSCDAEEEASSCRCLLCRTADDDEAEQT